MKQPVNCNLPLSDLICYCDTPFKLCLPPKEVVFLIWTAISKRLILSHDKDQSQQGPSEWQYFEESVGIYCLRGGVH